MAYSTRVATCRHGGFDGRISITMGMPSLQLLRPIERGSSLVFLLHRQYQCHTCICIQLRSLSGYRDSPNIHLPPSVPSRPQWFPRDMESWVVVGRVRWPGNAGWSCVDNQSHESNGHRLEKEGHQLPENGQEHHPTGYQLAICRT